MYIKKLSLLFVVFLLITNISAQTTPAPIKTFKFGHVDPKEFEIKGTGQDSAAAAVKIFDIGKGHFEINTSSNFVYVFERHVRYKIINKAGYELADRDVQLYNNGNGSEEKLEFFKAVTYNLANQKIETSKLETGAKFSNRIDKNHIVKKFTLPNVKEGSIIEYVYKTKSDFVFRLDDWYFQGGYPCIYSAFTLTIPEYYNYKIWTNGFIKINSLNPETLRVNYHIPNNSVSKSGDVIIVGATMGQYYAENIPAIKQESFITTLDDYVAKMSFELASSQFPESPRKDYTSTWRKIVTSLMEEEKFGEYIKSKNEEGKLVSSIIKDEKDSIQKAKLIFNYVKEQLKWDGKYGINPSSKNQKELLSKKTGNIAEINLLLYKLLKEAGIDSYPVLISTRSNGKHPGYPIATKFNSIIVCVKAGGKSHLFDASDKSNTIDLISMSNLNHTGLLIDPASTEVEWISTESTDISREVIFYSLKMDQDHKFTGTLSLSSNSYKGLNRRNQYTNAVNEAEYIKNYKNNKLGLEISNYKITNLLQPDETLEESMDITIEDQVEEAGNLSYFMPLLFDRTKENPFQLEERLYPVDFAYPNEEYYRIMIEFPENYSIDKLPKGEKFVLPDDKGSFTINYSIDGSRIAVVSKITLKKSTYSSDEYFMLKELFKNIVKKQAEQIIIKKS